MDQQKGLSAPSTRLADYTYPTEKVILAKEPCSPRDHSKLLVLNRQTGEVVHTHFYEILRWLRPGDVLVANETKVIPARLLGTSETGGKVEVLLVEEDGPGVWQVMLKSASGGRPGQILSFGSVKAQVLGRGVFENGATARLEFEGDPLSVGQTPLPPYLAKGREDRVQDLTDYQTLYARLPGSIAAPTAGLHFTQDLLKKIVALGTEWLTVHHRIGPGTFRPVEAADLRDHVMHREVAEIPVETARRLRVAQAEGRRVIAVGTSSVRALETWAVNHFEPGQYATQLWVYPGFEFKVVNAMITNFHQTESPPLIMTCAFGGRERVLGAYAEAIESGYRFYSFGDSMMMV